MTPITVINNSHGSVIQSIANLPETRMHSEFMEVSFPCGDANLKEGLLDKFYRRHRMYSVNDNDNNNNSYDSVLMRYVRPFTKWGVSMRVQTVRKVKKGYILYFPVYKLCFFFSEILSGTFHTTMQLLQQRLKKRYGMCAPSFAVCCNYVVMEKQWNIATHW